jgi:hydrogenase nickel incorporation protein HypB
MCTTCGCGSNEVLISGKTVAKRAARKGAPGAVSYRPRAAALQTQAEATPALIPLPDHNHAPLHNPDPANTRRILVERDLLAKNDALASTNRAFFTARHMLTLNLVSSPGSGKTTLLVRTIEALKNKKQLAVIEGDQQTENDAERIRATGVQAIQINTGKGCHLDAGMVGLALKQLSLPAQSVLFIENVGNLVCPASFDLGEECKVVVLSVTEGEDKPLKYPDMFRAARLMLLNKCDLLPYLNFDVALVAANARRVNPDIEIIQLSASSGVGMDEWLEWITHAQQQ